MTTFDAQELKDLASRYHTINRSIKEYELEKASLRVLFNALLSKYLEATEGMSPHDAASSRVSITDQELGLSIKRSTFNTGVKFDIESFRDKYPEWADKIVQTVEVLDEKALESFLEENPQALPVIQDHVIHGDTAFRISVSEVKND